MLDECGFDVYISRMKVFEERENDPLAIAVEEQRLEFYAVLEEIRERWFQLEAVYRRTGDPGPLHNIFQQILAMQIQESATEVQQAENHCEAGGGRRVRGGVGEEDCVIEKN